MIVLKILIRCQSALSATYVPTSDGMDYLTETARTLVDDFCASIPFHLGNRTTFVGPNMVDELEFPSLPSVEDGGILQTILPNALGYSWTAARSEHARIATSHGAWLLRMPMRQIMKAITISEADATIGLSHFLREGQREWLMAQGQRIRKTHAISGHLSGPSSPG
jgi:hypothetical protein